MKQWEVYHRPESIAEALRLLNQAPGRARVIAGGTDLLLDLQQGRHPPVHTLVEVNRIGEMHEIRSQDGWILLGAACTLRSILDHPTLGAQAPLLAEACRLIGGDKVRNVATIGGNVAHALPAADGTIALLALGAEAEIASMEGHRWQPLRELFAGPGRTTFDRGRELLLGFRFPAMKPGEGMAFSRVNRPQRMAIAVLNMAVRLRFSEEKRVEAVRLAVGPAGPIPFCSQSLYGILVGRKLDRETLERARRALLAEVSLRTSPHRATKAYREHLMGVLLRRILATARERSAAMQEMSPPGI